MRCGNVDTFFRRTKERDAIGACHCDQSDRRGFPRLEETPHTLVVLAE